MPDVIAGRLYDVGTFTGTPVGAVGVQVISALDPGWPEGRAITGVAKLGQRVLLELLTEAGSISYQPTRGTGFMTAVRNGWIQADADAFQQFNFAANTILRNLALDATSADPPDEVLADLNLVNVLFSPGQLAISFTMTTAAGTSATYILPVGAEP